MPGMPTLKPIKPQKDLTVEKARILARLKADGCVYKSGKRKTNYYVKYDSKEVSQLQQFADDIKRIYGLDVTWGTKNSGKTGKPLPFVFVRSKNAYEDLMKFGPFKSQDWKITKEILDANRPIKQTFLRAFFDDEGTVIVKGRQVRLYSINLSGLEQITKLLLEFGIKSRIVSGYGAGRNVFAIVIAEAASLRNFFIHVGFGLKEKSEKLRNLTQNN